ncbi:MAG: Nif11-like leader peptide family natural product precursor [Ruminiclostridium sp.]|nr:Nif11-like leader peptide family natural product precursor [Ruminiclostridium sp.]MBP3856218.1 Nif11-like leader peptide family natural product precursor [Ruminiclostridium sp.]
MSKESAKKLITELQTNEELKAKIAGITDIAELAKKAVEAGYDVTEAELIEVEKEQRAAQAAKTDEKLSLDDLDAVAGGVLWNGDDAPDGHEMGCFWIYYNYDQCLGRDWWCSRNYFCISALRDRDENKLP